MDGIYLHIPFCEKKCVYCDFYSVENLHSLERFLGSLEVEIDRYAEFGRSDVEFGTIYFGGGTPSLLQPRQLARIFEKLHQAFRVSPSAEVTLETNPGTVDVGKLKSFFGLGVNRLSVGIQSFHDDELKFLSRIHTAKGATDCVRSARKAGFENISLDLIFALPNQDLGAWKENLSTAVGLEPEHISAYSLIVEEGTPLARMVKRGEVVPVREGLESEMYAFTMEFLTAHGFEHYEVSNYAKPGYRSRHNSLYWNHGSYLGFGPSAHSFWAGRPLSSPARWWNVSSIARYCEKLARGDRAVEGEESLQPHDLLIEEIFLGLRSGGIDVHKLQTEYGVNLFDRCSEKLHRLLHENFLVFDCQTLRLTPKGFLVCDGIALELIA
jgi:oxygen-independent coproporphyrinogen-3 oxidase